eukprot:31071-Pelagococcus_subviridis.AAC.19
MSSCPRLHFAYTSFAIWHSAGNLSPSFTHADCECFFTQSVASTHVSIASSIPAQDLLIVASRPAAGGVTRRRGAWRGSDAGVGVARCRRRCGEISA